MNSLLKEVFGDSLEQLLCCVSAQADRKSPGISHRGRRSREDYLGQLRALEEEKKKRDADFAQRQAERAAMRIHLREKYQLQQ
ncbi:hypothetical protein chiPu_0024365, partial [Chiloscyllium punctatum]|nr:hypothetical protein [Chiloscyllium punctatum]